MHHQRGQHHAFHSQYLEAQGNGAGDQNKAQCGDYVLVAKSDMVSFADSLVAPLSVVNALLVALSAKREPILEKNFDTLERVWEEYHIYEKQVKLP